MRKIMIPVFLVSVVSTIILLIMIFTGVIDFNNGHIEALMDGNRFFVVKKYDKALEAYKVGLSKKPEDIDLNQNSGLAAYQLNNYEEALKYYAKAPDRVEKYIKTGNVNLKMGDKGSESNEKLKFYQQALQIYKQGIIKFPQNVDLKYNYEYCKKKIDELQDKNNQNQQNQQNQENQQNQQGQENQQGKQNQQNEQGQENQQDKQNQQNQQGQENQQDKQNQQDQQGQNNQQDKQNQQSQQDEHGKGDKEDKEALIQAQKVLEMLEQQEEESLKNNQEIKRSGKEAEHDW